MMTQHAVFNLGEEKNIAKNMVSYKMSIVFCLIVFLLTFACSDSPTQNPTPLYLTIQNDTSIVINSVFLRLSGQDDWGDDIYGGFIAIGESAQIVLSEAFDTQNLYDIRLVAEDEFTFTITEIEIYEGLTIVFTDDDKDIEIVEPDPDPFFYIRNNTGVVINGVYVRLSGVNDDWGEDLVAGSIYVGSLGQITLPDTFDIPDVYDIQLRAGNDVTFTRLNELITQGRLLTFTLSDKDDSGEEGEIEIPHFEHYTYSVEIKYDAEWYIWVNAPLNNVRLLINSVEISLFRDYYCSDCGTFHLYNTESHTFIAGQSYNLSLLRPNMSSFTAHLTIAHKPTITQIVSNPDGTVYSEWILSQNGDAQAVSTPASTPPYQVALQPYIRSHTIPAEITIHHTRGILVENYTMQRVGLAMFYSKQDDRVLVKSE